METKAHKLEFQHLILLASIFAVVAAFVNSHLREVRTSQSSLPKNAVPSLRSFEVETGGFAGGWTYAHAGSASAFRGPNLPTIIIGRGSSKAIPELDGTTVPYIIIVDHPEDASFAFSSILTNSELDQVVTTEAIFNEVPLKIVHTLDHVVEHNIVEKMLVGDNRFDVQSGRVFVAYYNNSHGSFDVTQLPLNRVSNSFMATRFRTNEDLVRPVQEWWRKTKKQLLEATAS